MTKQITPKKNLILTIDQKYFIEVDPKQYFLKEKRKNAKGVLFDHNHGSFTTLDYLLMRLARLRVSDTHNKLTVDEYIQLMRDELEQLAKVTTGL